MQKRECARRCGLRESQNWSETFLYQCRGERAGKTRSQKRSYMMLALITKAIRRGSAPYCDIQDRLILLEKLTDYQGNRLIVDTQPI